LGLVTAEVGFDQVRNALLSCVGSLNGSVAITRRNRGGADRINVVKAGVGHVLISSASMA
jgi:hypothetical protein